MQKETDLTFLESFTGGNPEKMKKYMNMFIQMCPGQLNLMSTHLKSENYDQLRAAAHSLKPQITYMGIKRGEPLVKSIEQMAAAKSDVEKLPAMLDEFSNICNLAVEELKQQVG
ncbi:MAG: Hpt domain-containing protein [Bacteroidia bacterium]|nr:Hpt domain-containing protein [Bacteroidia bacterium]